VLSPQLAHALSSSDIDPDVHDVTKIFSKSLAGHLSDSDSDDSIEEEESDSEFDSDEDASSPAPNSSGVTYIRAATYTLPTLLSPLLLDPSNPTSPPLLPSPDPLPPSTAIQPRLAVIDELSSTFLILRAAILIQTRFRINASRALTSSLRIALHRSAAATTVQKLVRSHHSRLVVSRLRVAKSAELARLSRAIEHAIVPHVAALSTASSTISSQEATISSLNGQISSLQDQISASSASLESAVASASAAAISSQEATISSLQEQISSLQEQISTSSASLESAVASASASAIFALEDEHANILAMQQSETESRIQSLKEKWNEDLLASKSRYEALEQTLESSKQAYFLEKLSDNETLSLELAKAESQHAEQSQHLIHKLNLEHEAAMHAANAAYFDEKVSESNTINSDISRLTALLEQANASLAEQNLIFEREKLVLLEQLNAADLRIEQINLAHQADIAALNETISSQTASHHNLTLQQSSLGNNHSLALLKLEEDHKLKLAEAHAAAREETFHKQEALQAASLADSKAEAKYEVLFQERVKSLQSAHDVELSQLITTWEERLEGANAKASRAVAKHERDSNLRVMERNREAELRHNEELDRLAKEKDDLLYQLKSNYESNVSKIKFENSEDVQKMQRSHEASIALQREEDRQKHERAMNDLKEDCNEQVLNIRKVLVGEQKNYEDRIRTTKRECDVRIKEIENRSEASLRQLEERHSRELYSVETKAGSHLTAVSNNFEDRISALQSLVAIKDEQINREGSSNSSIRQRSASSEVRGKMFGAASTLPHPLTSSPASVRAANVPPDTPPQFDARSAIRFISTPNNRSPLEALMGGDGNEDLINLADDDEFYGVSASSFHGGAPSSSFLHPSFSNNNNFDSEATQHVARLESKRKNHVSHIESLLSRRGERKPPPSYPPPHKHTRLPSATQKMGAGIVYRVWARHLRGTRNASFDHWKRSTYEFHIVRNILKRVIMRRSRMQLLLGWYTWLNSVRSRKIAEIEGKGKILEKQLGKQIDSQYDAFVNKIEFIQRENEIIRERMAAKSAVDSESVLVQLRNELGRVEVELDQVKMGRLREMEERVRRIEEGSDRRDRGSPEQTQVEYGVRVGRSNAPNPDGWDRGGYAGYRSRYG
jgi:hypothetical protein